MTIPKKIIAGDYIQWTLKATQDVFGNPISSPDWAVTYYLRTNKQNFAATINSTPHEDGFKFTISQAVSATFHDGLWFLIGFSKNISFLIVGKKARAQFNLMVGFLGNVLRALF